MSRLLAKTSRLRKPPNLKAHRSLGKRAKRPTQRRTCDVQVGTAASLAPAFSAEFRMSRTCHKVVVNHPGRLHQRVADG